MSCKPQELWQLKLNVALSKYYHWRSSLSVCHVLLLSIASLVILARSAVGIMFCTSANTHIDRLPKPALDAPATSPPGLRKVLPSSLGAALTPHENIYTIPNLLTFSRLIAAPFVGYAILHDAHAWALGLFVYAGVSDLLDGWIARRWHLQTVVGSIVDPMADKALMTILTVCLAAKGALPGTSISSKLCRGLVFVYQVDVRGWRFKLSSQREKPR
jgi:hypothetical protein